MTRLHRLAVRLGHLVGYATAQFWIGYEAGRARDTH